MANRVFECAECGKVWEEKPCSEGGKHGYEIHCPQCDSLKKTKLVDGVRHACGGQGHTHDHGHHGQSGQQGGCCSH